MSVVSGSNCKRAVPYPFMCRTDSCTQKSVAGAVYVQSHPESSALLPFREVIADVRRLSERRQLAYAGSKIPHRADIGCGFAHKSAGMEYFMCKAV